MATATANRRNAGGNRGEGQRANAPAARRQDPFTDMVEYVDEYARREPMQVALWCLGIGFVLGWKLKPW